jgi:hypothetical protein
MFELLVDAFTPWPEIADDCRHSSFSRPLVDDELTVGGQCALGFDYNVAVGDEREYIFAVTRWIGLKVGRRRRQFKGVTFDEPVPYWRPTGTDPQPIITKARGPRAPNGVPIYNSFGVATDQATIRELAWYHIPLGAHELVATTHHAKSIEEIRNALVNTGRDGALDTLRLIGAHISRLDALWVEP